MLYYNYTVPGTNDLTAFGSGFLINGTTARTYPVHNFLFTPLTYEPWVIEANFTANVTRNWPPMTVKFTDDSTGYPNRWDWDLGDGTLVNSTTQNPIHTYTEPGVHEITLRAYLWQNESVYDEEIKTDYIIVEYLPPIADYEANVTEGVFNLAVQFTGTNTGDPGIDFNWSFGDGGYSDEKSPEHTYSLFGTHPVNFTISNLGGSSSKEGNITVWNRTTSDFSSDVVTGNIPFDVAFTDISENATIWNWSFGDGSYADTQNAIHTYSGLGYYSVSHSTSNGHWTNWTNKTDYIFATELPPVADFTQNVTEGLFNLNVQFTNTSTGVVRTLLWDFGDGSTTSTPSPLHMYSSGGTYVVNLTVNNTAGASSKLGSVTVHNRTSVSFTADPIICLPNVLITLTDLSSNATSWYWEFGDDSTSLLQNPTHAYTDPGVYTIKHRASNPYHTSWNNQTNLIKIEIPVVAGYTANPTSGTTPLTVTFTESSSGTPTSWNWSFGDGTYSNLQTPLDRVFSNIGINTVTLTAWKANSTDDYSSTIQVNKLPGSTGGTTPTLDPTVTTQAATHILQGSAVLHGNLGNPGNGWFMYGGQSNTYTYTTRKVNLPTAGEYYAVVKNGMYNNRTMYYRAVSDNGAGLERTFVVGQVEAVSQTEFGSKTGDLTGSKLDPVVFAEVLPSAFGDSFGGDSDTGTTIFWGFIFLVIFIVLYIRSENVTTPALLGMVIGWAVMSYVPGEFAMAGQALLIVALGAGAFTIIKGRIR